MRRASATTRQLSQPRVARVVSGDGGCPLRIDGRHVDAVRETWLLEDRWWTDRPLRRRYWEVVTDHGELIVLFRDLMRGGWYRQ